MCKRIESRLGVVVFVALSLFGVCGAQAQLNILPKTTVVPSCSQPSTFTVECSYHLTDTVPLYNISASVGSQTLPAPQRTEFPAADSRAAILFLIDTSDPRRANVVARNVSQVEALLAKAQAHHVFGLATFDSDLRVLAPLGTSSLNLLEAVRDIRATGKTTELYRNTMEGIALLKRYPADRKAIFLFSDGLAEDRAYHNNDVVSAARDAGVVIYSLGFPRSVLMSVALQTIRRLAEETGGHFVAADLQAQLPGTFMQAPFEMLDSGGSLSIDLSQLEDSSLTGTQALRIDWETDGGSMVTYSDIKLPVPMAPAVVAMQIVPAQAGGAPAHAAPVAPAPTTVQTDPLATWLVYGIWGVAGFLVLILMLWALKKELGKQKDERAPQGDSAELPSYAFLEVLDGSGVKHPITTTAFRLGRHSDNDLKLADNTVSRHHAEILRRRDGTFSITDLDSVNGVTVNTRSIKTAVLQEGDELECGDISMRFTVAGSDMDDGDDTVLLNTKIPYLEVS